MIYPWRKRSIQPAPKLRARSEKRSAPQNQDRSQQHFDTKSLIGFTAYFELKLFSLLSELAGTADNLVNAEAISLAAGTALNTHHDLTRLLLDEGADPFSAMGQHRPVVDRFFQAVESKYLPEVLLTGFIGAGLIEDFIVELLPMHSDAYGVLNSRVSVRERESVISEVLNSLLEQQPGLADRMALWGRRLVGDMMLACYSAVGVSGADALKNPTLSAAMTKSIATHTRRMDSLGLTA